MNFSENYMGLSYPDGADVSLGDYDLIVNNVSWESHHGSKFECQVQSSKDRKRTRKATLSVLGKATIIRVDRTSLIRVLLQCNLTYHFFHNLKEVCLKSNLMKMKLMSHVQQILQLQNLILNYQWVSFVQLTTI